MGPATETGRRIEALLNTLTHGLCAGRWKEFVELPRGNDAPRRTRLQRQTCHRCPVILTCAVYSDTIGDKEGTWAGITYYKNGKTNV